MCVFLGLGLYVWVSVSASPLSWLAALFLLICQPWTPLAEAVPVFVSKLSLRAPLSWLRLLL